jgi:hypothetical protein
MQIIDSDNVVIAPGRKEAILPTLYIISLLACLSPLLYKPGMAPIQHEGCEQLGVLQRHSKAHSSRLYARDGFVCECDTYVEKSTSKKTT